jgi:hypothetical protein
MKTRTEFHDGSHSEWEEEIPKDLEDRYLAILGLKLCKIILKDSFKEIIDQEREKWKR